MTAETITTDELGFPLLTARAPRRGLTPDQYETVEALETRARRVLGTGFWWPYGPNIRVASRMALLDWAEPLGLRQSRSRRECLHWLAAGRCTRRDCLGMGTKSVNGEYRNWADHLTAWYVPGTDLRLLVAQPYLALDEVRGLPDGFHVVTSPGGWYGLGTCLIEIWSRDPGGAR